MKIVITGAAGLVGAKLAAHFAGSHEVLALRHRDLDITDRAAVRRLILSEHPSLVINCAVVNVDDCERDPHLAQAINIDGPRWLAEAAAEKAADFLHFTTNYVFDGEPVGRAPYTAQDEARPINVYGQTKLAGERAVCAASSRSFIVRTSWVFGPGKDNFLSTAHHHLLSSKRIRAVTDVWASATYVGDLVARTSEILARGRYGLYHVVNSGVCSYYDFAVEAARLAGLGEMDAERLIEKVNEAEAHRLARRPRYTPMRCLLSEELGLAAMRDWRAALADFVQRSQSSGG